MLKLCAAKRKKKKVDNVRQEKKEAESKEKYGCEMEEKKSR